MAAWSATTLRVEGLEADVIDTAAAAADGSWGRGRLQGAWAGLVVLGFWNLDWRGEVVVAGSCLRKEGRRKAGGAGRGVA